MPHQAVAGEPDSKRSRKQSAITRRELIALYETLQRARQRITEMAQVGEDGDGDQEEEDLFTIGPAAQKLAEVLKMLEPKVHGRPVFPLSSIQQGEIDTLNVREGQNLELRDDPARLSLEQERGVNQLWSNDVLYRHLCLLQGLVTQTEASARTWIDAIVFRALVMLSSSLVEQRKQLVLGLKLPVSATVGQAVLKGFIDYTILKAGKTPAASFLRAPQLSKLAKESDLALFVAEAKAVGVPLGQQVPQALEEMYACAATLKSDGIIRGALTNGRVWIFLLLKTNADEPGATYHVSHEVSIMGADHLFRPQVDPKTCATVAAIVAYWIEHSFEDIGDEDWFKFASQ